MEIHAVSLSRKLLKGLSGASLLLYQARELFTELCIWRMGALNVGSSVAIADVSLIGASVIKVMWKT